MFNSLSVPTVTRNRRNMRILRALSQLGDSRFDQSLTLEQWVHQAEQLGLLKTLIAPRDRFDGTSLARAMHKLFWRFCFEVFYTASREHMLLFESSDDDRSEIRWVFRSPFQKAVTG